jgi:hypothetical protein
VPSTEVHFSVWPTHLSSSIHSRIGQITVRIVWLVQLKSLTGLGQLQSLANDRYQETNLGVGVGIIVSFNDLQFERLLL